MTEQDVAWNLNFLHVNPLRYLRKVCLSGILIDLALLPHFVSLPSIDELSLSILPSVEIREFKVPRLTAPRQSTLKKLALSGVVSALQLEQIISWPKALQSFEYSIPDSRGPPQETVLITEPSLCGENREQPLLAEDWNRVLRHTAGSLERLKIHIRAAYWIGIATSIQRLDLCKFAKLNTVNVPSLLLFGSLKQPGYTRGLLHKVLPSSLQSLKITFGDSDNVLAREVILPDLLNHTNKVWISDLLSQLCPWGHFAALQDLALHDLSSSAITIGNYQLENMFRNIPRGRNVSIRYSPKMYDANNNDWSYDFDEWYAYPDTRYEQWIWDNQGYPMTGEEEYQYSDTTSCFTVDEDEYDARLDEDAFWERLDRRMGEEMEARGLKWPRGACPDYEETREEREEMIFHDLVDFDHTNNSSVLA